MAESVLNPALVSSNSGYTHPRYAEALHSFGNPFALPGCEGHLLARSISDTAYQDAMGLYPLFVCPNWKEVGNDLEGVREDWISVTLVVDPFAPSNAALEAQGFDIVQPFKAHWLVDLRVSYEEATSKHHRYYTRRAARDGVEVDRVAPCEEQLEVWTRMYGHLIDRHDITGIQAFSRASFRKQFAVPGLVLFVAKHHGEPVGMHLWYEMGEVAYSHLAACNSTGYDTQASYALHKAAADYFRPRVTWLNLGGGAGTSSDEVDGLARFKKGWATTSAPARLCGRILQPAIYKKLTRNHDRQDATYFPKYRDGELV